MSGALLELQGITKRFPGGLANDDVSLTGDVWDGMKEGTVVLSPWSKKIPPDVVALAEKARNGIVAGTLHAFTGPIKKQDGSPWLKAGETATDRDLSSMNLYVEGMEGALPK